MVWVKQDHAGLRRAVGAQEGEGPLARLARDVADPTADAGRHHAGGAGLRHQPRADDVDVEDAAELVGRDVEQGAEAEAGAAPAGDVRHERDGTELLGAPPPRRPRRRPRPTRRRWRPRPARRGRRSRWPGWPGRSPMRSRGTAPRRRAGRCRGRRRPPRRRRASAAVARPMPRGRAAPVTSATWPANGRSGIACGRLTGPT